MGVGLLLVVGATIFGLESNSSKRQNPLADKVLYSNSKDNMYSLLEKFPDGVDGADAELLKKIADQPDAVWLVGPSETDITAKKDIDEVGRTSTEAQAQSKTPVYVLYAIPKRDTCGGESLGGFKTADEYKTWVNSIIGSLSSPAVFIVEPDAIAQGENSGCLAAAHLQERYDLLDWTVTSLAEAPQNHIIYLDAGHSEWYPNPEDIIEPLKKAGIDKADGISTNVSFFVATAELTDWAQKLVQQLDGDKGVVIDTSRNGRGVPPASEQGMKRWCNPPGRGLGNYPTTGTGQANIDAFIWIKKIGESDGACFGHQPAGIFEEPAILELIKNAKLE